MNGEMYQLCSMVAAGKRALQSGEPFQFAPGKYENKITFSYLSKGHPKEAEQHTSPGVKTWFGQLKSMGLQGIISFMLGKDPQNSEIDPAASVKLWFDRLKSRGLKDIKFLCPVAVESRELLGFSNTTQGCILCFYKSGKVTYFTAHWQVDPEKKLWNIHYSEEEWRYPPSGRPHFDNNTDSFRQILLKIKDFAAKIEFEGFAHTFDSAITILDGGEDYPDKKYGLPLPQIPPENLRIFEAASCADVFGAMGSWNDSPAFEAQTKGLGEEYEQLSDELLRNIRLAILYAVNEW